MLGLFSCPALDAARILEVGEAEDYYSIVMKEGGRKGEKCPYRTQALVNPDALHTCYTMMIGSAGGRFR